MNEPKKLERNGYVMRLAAGAGNIRPRVPPPAAPLAVTQERLAATAASRASRSSGQLMSTHKAQKRARAPASNLGAARLAPTAAGLILTLT